MKHLGWLIVLAIGAVAASGYFFLSANPAVLSKWSGGDREIAVRVALVRRHSLPAMIRLAGELSPVQEADIVSRLAGKVAEVRFKVGDAVSAGAIVAIIQAGALVARTTELDVALDAARKDHKSSEELAMRADKQLAQSREWYRQNLIARRDLEQAETAAETTRAQAELARANLAQQEAMLAQVRTLQSLTRLSAPFSGVVTRRWLEPGAGVGESAPVLTIANLSKLKIAAKFADPHSEEIHAGMKVEISSAEAPSKTFGGKIIRVEPETDGDKQIRRIDIEVENFQQSLRSGTAAQALIALEKQEVVLLVPRTAVVSLDGKTYVFKSVDGRAVRQDVRLGVEHGEDVVIEQGIKDGESIIVDNQASLKPNSPIRVLTAPASARSERR
jgi:RND family efflux transporter MFP subunit